MVFQQGDVDPIRDSSLGHNRQEQNSGETD